MKSLIKILKFICQHPLSGKHKIKALYTFFVWQFTQLLFPRMVACEFVNNTKIWAKKGMEAATANIYTGLHEFNEMSFLLHFLRPHDLFVDVGANIGSYTILASGVVGAETICIEPVRNTFNLAVKNIALNNIESKTDLLNIGVSSKEGYLFFTNTKGSLNHVVLNIENQSQIDSVPVKTLDNILRNNKCPALIKIDVEGYEQEVINGASNTLEDQNLKAIIIELNGGAKNYGFDEKNIHTRLLLHGFNPYTYYPFDRKLKPLSNWGTNNTIYIRDYKFVEKRVSTGEKIRIFSETF